MAKHISKQEQRLIKQNLPNVDLILTRSDDEGDYQKIIVSVFDHWMTREEFVVYDDVDHDTLMERRRKFENFATKLYNNSRCFLWKYKRHYRVFIYQATSIEQVLNKCDIKNQTHMTANHYAILLPEYAAAYTSEFDWTTIIWFRDEKKIQPLLSMIKESGLHILD